MEAANAAFYAAFETADLDAMREVWLDDPGSVCVHPGAVPVRGAGAINRSWALIMANTPYIQFFLNAAEQLESAVGAGIAPGRIAVDPGIGFSKTADQSWDVLGGLERLHELGHPVLVAASRKRFLGALLADAPGELRPAHLREDGTTATSALAAAAGAWCVRTHSVGPTLDAVRVAARWAGHGA